jgi:YVTN family beta-propeller protein
MTSARAPTEEHPSPGEERSPLSVIALFAVTLGAYWLIWLRGVYASLAHRSPRPTRVSATRVVLLQLVPVVNLAWTVFIAVDLPRAIRRLGTADGDAPDTEVLSILVLLPVLGGAGIAIALGLSAPLALLVAGYLTWPLELPAVLALQRALARTAGGRPAATRKPREVSLAVAVALALGATLVATIALGGDEESAPPAPTQQVPQVSDIAVTREALWVTNTVRGTVLKLDRRTRRPLAPPIPVGQKPLDIAAGRDAVWVVNYQSGTVLRIDPVSNQLTGPIRTGRGPFGVAVGAGGVWVSNQVERTVTRIDPGTSKLAGPPVTVGRGPRGVDVGEGAVWVANGEGKSVSRVVPGEARARETPITRFVHDVAAGEGSVWVTVPEDDVVRRIDPRTGKLRPGAISVLGGPGSIEVGLGFVWVASESGTVTPIDPRRARMVRTPIEVGGRVSDLTVGDDEIWVLRQDGRIRRIPGPARR